MAANSTDETTDAEIRKLQVTKWRTLGTVVQENVRSLVHTANSTDHFSQDYLKNMGDRWRELQKTNYRLSVILLALLIFVGTIESGVTQNITIFGIRISSDNSALALLVLVSSVLMFFTSIVSLIETQYGGVIKALALDKMNDDLAKYYLFQFGWDTGAIFDGHKSQDDNLLANIFVLALILFLFSLLILAAVMLATLELYIFATAILFIYENPKLPTFINMPIVVVATSAALFNIGGFLLRLPLPYSDNSSLKRLTELEESDPERAKEIWMNIAEYSLRKERRNILILQLVIMLVTLTGLYLIVAGREFLSNYAMLVPLATATFCFVYFVSPLFDKYERSVILAEKAIGDEQQRVVQYTRDKRRILRIRLALSFVFGMLTFLFFETDRLVEGAKTWTG